MFINDQVGSTFKAHKFKFGQNDNGVDHADERVKRSCSFTNITEFIYYSYLIFFYLFISFYIMLFKDYLFVYFYFVSLSLYSAAEAEAEAAAGKRV